MGRGPYEIFVDVFYHHELDSVVVVIAMFAGSTGQGTECRMGILYLCVCVGGGGGGRGLF